MGLAVQNTSGSPVALWPLWCSAQEVQARGARAAIPKRPWVAVRPAVMPDSALYLYLIPLLITNKIHF